MISQLTGGLCTQDDNPDAWFPTIGNGNVPTMTQRALPMIKYAIDYKMDGCTDQAINVLERLYSYVNINDLQYSFDKSYFRNDPWNSYILCPDELNENCYYTCKIKNPSLDQLYNFLNTEFSYE